MGRRKNKGKTEKSVSPEKFQNFINQNLPVMYRPQYSFVTGYNEDWTIIGEHASILFRKGDMLSEYINYVYRHNEVMKDNKFIEQVEVFPKTFRGERIHYYLVRLKVLNLVRWLSQNVFHPNFLVFTDMLTARVRLHIGVTMLNKIDMPRNLKDNIFTSIIDNFYHRSWWYHEYNIRVLLGLPF